MKKSNGFSLVEAIVVLAIFTVILSLGIPAFSSWRERQVAEAQIFKLYSDLQYARMKAYSEKVTWGLWWGTSKSFNAYNITKDGNNDADVNDSNDGKDKIEESVPLKFTITSNVASSIDFNGRGFSNNLATFRIASAAGAAHDCISISRTRIIMGKWNGSDCIPK